MLPAELHNAWAAC